LSVLALLLVGVVLLVLVRMNHPIAGKLRAHLLGAVTPVVTLASKPVEKARNVVNEKNDMLHAYEENKKLRAENDTLRRWQEVAQALKTENESLRALAGYQPVDRARYVTARVVGQSPDSYSASVVLNVGEAAGVKMFQPVIDAYGLMGRVVDVAEKTSQVQLLSDATSRVPVITGTSRHHAILAGTGDDLLRLTFVGGDSAAIALGEPVVTTEEGDLIPGGILIGTVFRREGAVLLVKPMRPLAQTEYARVIVTK
jgi:rod shape-determining protein MreC